MSQQTPDNSLLNRSRVILSVNRAMWGEVSHALRSLQVSWTDNSITLYFFYDGKISEEDKESAECIATEVIADYPDHKLEILVNQLDCPASIPEKGDTVFLRRET